jgi:kynurenine formamidase
MVNGVPRYRELPQASGGGRSAWGLYGSDDSVGRINLLTSERVLDSVQLVRRGATFALNAAVDEFDPPLDSTRSAARHRYLEVGGDQGVEDLDDALDDYFPQISSQWDSLAHVAATPGVFYNNASLQDVMTRGANTIDHWATRGIVGRAILLDVRRVASQRSGGEIDTSHGSISLSVEDLEAAREQAGVSFSTGCVVLLRTGFIEWYRQQDLPTREALNRDLHAPGIEHTEAMASYLWDSGVAAIASDTFATEVWPPDWSETARPFGFLHRVLIGQLGMAIGELWDLDALAQDCQMDGVYEFLLVSAPLNVRRGIASPANAIALK